MGDGPLSPRRRLTALRSLTLAGLLIVLAFPLPVAARDFNARLEDLGRDLADARWNIRREATRKLVALGDTVLPFAFRLLHAPDAEVRARARIVLGKNLESPLLLREAFRAGERGTDWVFGRVIDERGRAEPHGLPLEEVVRAAGFYGGPAAVPHLARCAALGVPGAADALALVGERDRALAACIERYRPDRPANLLHALGKLGGRDAASFLREKAASGTPLERHASVAALKALAETRTVEGLARAMVSEGSAAREARRMLETSAPPRRLRVADRILRLAGREEERSASLAEASWVQTAVPPALFSFRRIADPLPAIARVLSESGEGPGARWALGVLSEWPRRPEALAIIVEALARPGLADAAKEALARTGGFAAPALGERLLTHPGSVPPGWSSVFVALDQGRCSQVLARILRGGAARDAREAARALGLLGGPEALDALEAGLERPAVRRACAASLGRMGAEIGLEKLAGLLSPRPSPALIEGLGRTGDPRALPLLSFLLGRRRLAPAAVRGLVRLGNARARTLVRRALADDRLWRAAVEAIGDSGDRTWLPLLDAFSKAARSLGLFDRVAQAERATSNIYRR